MKSIFKTLIISSIALLSVACSDNRQNVAKEETPELSLLGKSITAVYPAMTAEITYISETELHWKTITKENEVAEDSETISYKKVGDNLFFISWIEKTGETVSQVVDLANNKVTVFLSYQDDDSTQGKRGSTFFEGTLTLNNQ